MGAFFVSFERLILDAQQKPKEGACLVYLDPDEVTSIRDRCDGEGAVISTRQGGEIDVKGSATEVTAELGLIYEEDKEEEEEDEVSALTVNASAFAAPMREWREGGGNEGG